jgi:hypothetical protein
MSKSHSFGGNSSFVSIRYASSTQNERDANNHEESHIPVIDIEALRSIRRIVLTIKERIAAGQQSKPGHDHQRLSGGDPSSSTDTGSNCSKNTNQEENR